MIKRTLERTAKIFFKDFFSMILAMSVLCPTVIVIGLLIVVGPQNLSFLELGLIALFVFLFIFSGVSIITMIGCLIVAATVPENQNG